MFVTVNVAVVVFHESLQPNYCVESVEFLFVLRAVLLTGCVVWNHILQCLVNCLFGIKQEPMYFLL